jgi:hypothetical protein
VTNVEFRKGFCEALPIEDGWADVDPLSGTEVGLFHPRYSFCRAMPFNRDKLEAQQVAESEPDLTQAMAVDVLPFDRHFGAVAQDALNHGRHF